MTRATLRFVRLTSACIALTACFTGRAQLADPATTAREEWSTTLAVAAQESGAGRHAVADRALADYATRFPASGDAAEANFWRALYKLDPANAMSTPRDAAVLLDSYLASPMIARRTEALTLRRLVSALESRPVSNGGTSTTAPRTDGPRADDKVKDDEIARLKDDLAKANAELERIRRRLAQPKP